MPQAYAVVMDTARPIEDRLTAFAQRAAWNAQLTQLGGYLAQINGLVADISQMGVVEQRHGPTGDPRFPPVLQVEDRYVNPALAPDYLAADFAVTTPYEYLMEVAPLQRVEHVVRAVQPDARIRGLLKLGAREPALLIERVTWSRAVPASFARLYHPGTRFELRGAFEV